MMRFVEIDGPNGTLRGTLHLREGGRPAPGVVMLHGFTGQRIESGFLFVQASRALETAGLASLRFDFHGSGESDGTFDEMTASTEQADAAAAIDFFKGLPEIDAARLGLLGISFGGMHTACTLGARTDLRAGVLWSAVGNCIQLWRQRLTPEDREMLDDRGWLDRAGLRLGKAFFDDLPRHKPYDAVARYGGPVLVVHGTDDQSVPLGDAEEYVRVLEARTRAATDHLFVPGGNHVFANWDHRQAVFGKTVAWFREHL